jgi:hypothetical protein
LLAGLLAAAGVDLALALLTGAVFAGFMVLLMVVLFEVVFDIGVDIGVAVLTGTTTAVLLAVLFAEMLALTLVEVPPHAMPIAVIVRSAPVAMILFIFSKSPIYLKD